MLLRDLLDDAVGTEPPPAPLDVDVLYRRAVRRRRAVTVARTAPVLLLVAALVGAALVATRGSGGGGGPDPADLADSAAWPGILWAGAADAQHLYATVRPCDSCPVTIHGSDDGGRTWTARSTDVPGATTLVDPAGHDLVGVHLNITPSGAIVQYSYSVLAGPAFVSYDARVSVDGARTWQALHQRKPPVASAPADAVLACLRTGPDTDTDNAVPGACLINVIDPRSALFAPLANQPPLWAGSVRRTTDGAVWVTGTDPTTGRPAVAESTDGGARWATRVFLEVPTFDPRSYDMRVAGRDGRVEVAISASWVFTRGADGWQRVVTGGWGSDGLAGSYITPDGRQVVITGEATRLSYWARRDGTTEFRRVDGAAFETGNPIEETLGGRFVTFTRASVLLSDDGWTWRSVRVG
jgi:hypothetical protein